MMRIVSFVVGFLVAMIPAVNYLAHKDPEPDMAGLSLIFFGFFVLVATLGMFCWSAMRLRASPGNLMALCAGTVCATLFYAAINFIPIGLGLFPVLGLAFVLALSTAGISSALSRIGLKP